MIPVNSTVLQNPNFQAFANLISAAEGTQKYGYTTAFGGGQLHSLDAHPNVSVPYNGSTTSAAGKYQFEKATWNGLAKQLGLKDFSPQSQDLAFAALLHEKGALQDVLSGNFNAAIEKVGPEWASLPTSAAGQNKRSWSFLAANDPTGQIKVPTGEQVMNAASTVAHVAAPIVPGAAPVAAGLDMAAAIPAKSKNAIGSIFEQLKTMAPAAPAAADATPPEPVDLTPDQHAQVADATARDVAVAREKAQAAFFNEPYVPKIELPPSIDDTINQYLSQL